jgi:TetR/AcrR family transcriptional regulator, regulator of cefoperazone and chloramphenicol sensitivity
LSTSTHATKRLGADSRQEILAVAVELFSAHGYAGTSIRDIAETVGMTKASLYYHFESKEQILQAVTEPLRDEMDELIRRATSSPALSPEQVITEMVDLLSRRAVLISTVFHDPSAFNREQREQSKRRICLVEGLLAGPSPTPADLVRARAALGAVQAGVLATAAGDPRFAEPPQGERVARLLAGGEHALEPEMRAEVVAAALRALGS